MTVRSKILKKYPKIFVVSSGRSGTTLLISILNASQQIYFPYESDFIARAYPFYQQEQNFSRPNYQEIVKFFRETSQPKGWGMTEEYLLSFLKERAPQTLRDINTIICEAYHQKQGTEDLMWGIKAPVLIASIDRILAVYPEAKIIHIVRDGRDVCLSYKSVHEKSKVKFGPQGVFANALYWVDGLRQVERFHQHQVYEFRYEDLLKNAEYELKNLCDFLAIEYDPSMHNDFYSQKDNEVILPERLMKIHDRVQGNLDPKNTQKYLTKMSKVDRFIFELIAVPYLKKYQYPSEFPFLQIILLSPLRQLLYLCARQLNNWRYSQRDRRFYQRAKANSTFDVND